MDLSNFSYSHIYWIFQVNKFFSLNAIYKNGAIIKRVNNILITINKTIVKHTTTTTFRPSKNKLPKTQKSSEFINSLKKPRKKHYAQSFG